MHSASTKPPYSERSCELPCVWIPVILPALLLRRVHRSRRWRRSRTSVVVIAALHRRRLVGAQAGMFPVGADGPLHDARASSAPATAMPLSAGTATSATRTSRRAGIDLLRNMSDLRLSAGAP